MSWKPWPILVVALLAPLGLLSGQQGMGKKYALLVGINEYQHQNLPALRFAENDAAQLASLLEKHKYQVTLLCNSTGAKDENLRPKKENIEKHLKKILGRCERLDSVVVAFAGHGLQFEKEEDAYFCPEDARPFADKKESLLSLKGIYKELEQSFAGVKLLMVDACRNDPKLPRGARTGIDADNAPRPPRGVGALFSCSAGEFAFENEKLKHGVFFHFVLEGLRGKAKNTKGQVTFNSLADYVNGSVAETVPVLIGEGAKQSPNQIADLRGASPVLLIPDGSPDPAAVLSKYIELDLGGGVKMKLVRIEPGTFSMGSPPGEKDRDGDEFQHPVEISKPFFMGIHEVTQAQYQRIIGKNPSWFSAQGDGNGKVAGLNTDDFPVEQVSWNDAMEFCRTASNLPQVKAQGWLVDLPTEAEWEYACRAGTKTPFHFGDTISTDQANYNGNYTYGNGAKGVNRERTVKVGSFAANAWGLYDMHGNVCEWCKDWYDKDYYKNSVRLDPQGPGDGKFRVLRGGSWHLNPRYCRSAYRNNVVSPDSRYNDVGFRVVVGLSPRTQ